MVEYSNKEDTMSNEENFIYEFEDLNNDDDAQRKVNDFMVQGAKEAYKSYHDVNAALFLIQHFFQKGDHYDPQFAYQVLKESYDREKLPEFSFYMGYFALYGIGREKDADAAIDFFLEARSAGYQFNSEVYLSLIYIDALNGYPNLDRGFYYVDYLVQTVLDDMKKTSTSRVNPQLRENQDQFRISLMMKEKMEKFLVVYQKARSLESTDREEAWKTYLSLHDFHFAVSYLIEAKLRFEGNLIQKDEEEALRLFHTYIETYLDNNRFVIASTDTPYIVKTDRSFGKIEMIQDNYPIHKKSMVERFIRQRKEEAEYGILSSMLLYGECYFNLFQDFPVDYGKALDIFTDLSLKHPYSKANLYLFFQYLYGLGTEKNLEKAYGYVKKVQEFDIFGKAMEAIYLFELQRYSWMKEPMVSFYVGESKGDLRNLKESLEQSKFDEKTKRKYAIDQGYDLDKDEFLPLMVIEDLENNKEERAYQRIIRCDKLGYNQAILLKACMEYLGVGHQKSLYLFKKDMNRFIHTIIATDKKELIENGYISDHRD